MVRLPEVARQARRRALTLSCAALGLLPVGAAADAPAALISLADGAVELLRGSQQHAAREGVALAGNDLLRTGAGTRVVRIEFADGRVLDLGPDTQALLPTTAAAALAGLPGTTAVVLGGWAKLSVPAAVNSAVGASSHLAAAGLMLQAPPAGTVLLHVASDGATMVFAESRGATLLQRGGHGARAADTGTVLREGDAWIRAAGSTAGSRVAGLSALRQVPPALADALPRRWNRMSGLAVVPSPGEPIRSGALVAWQGAEPALMAAVRPRANAVGGKPLRKSATRVSLPTPGHEAHAHADPMAPASEPVLPARIASSAALPALAPARAPTPVARIAAPALSDASRRR